MLYNVDSRLKFDLDVGWVTSGGYDPVEVLKRLEGRIACIHVKDFLRFTEAVEDGGEGSFIEGRVYRCGNGSREYSGVLKELDRQSVEYACVEQDIMRNLNPREALTMSYLAMKESGYVW